MGANVRQEAIKHIACAKHQLNRVDFKKTHVKDLFGVNVFNEEVQRQRLPKPMFKALQKTIKQGADLFALSGERASYRNGFEISEINAESGSEYLRFSNGRTLRLLWCAAGFRRFRILFSQPVTIYHSHVNNHRGSRATDSEELSPVRSSEVH